MKINGVDFWGKGVPFGVSEKHYNEEPSGWPKRAGREEAKRHGKVGGVCTGFVILDGLMKEMANHNRYLEIGTFDGVFLSLMANCYPDKEFYAVDSFQRPSAGNLKFFVQNCKDCPNIHLYVGRSIDVLKKVQGKFGLVFVDGDHGYESARYDLFYCYENLMEPGGVLALHDYSVFGVNRACTELCAKYGLRVEHAMLGHHIKIRK